MPSYTRRSTLRKCTALGAAVGLSGLAGCNAIDDDGMELGFNFTVPIENTGSLFDIPEIRDELTNVGEEYELSISHDGEEYELSISHDGATTDSVNSLAAGETDVILAANVSYANTIIGEAVPGGITAVASGFGDAYDDHYSFTVYSLPDSDITEPEDLEGQTLAVNTRGGGIYAVYVAQLLELGLGPDDVEFIEQGFPTFTQGLRDGIFDVAIYPALFAPEPRAEGFTEIFNSSDVLSEYPHAYVVAGNDALEQKEDRIRAFLEDYDELIDYAHDNRDEVVSLASEHFEIGEEQVDDFYLTENDYYRGDAELDMDALQYSVDILNEVDVIEQEIDVSEHATNEYVP